MSGEPVQTVDVGGRIFILPPGVEPVTRYQDSAGGLHDTPEAAAKANARRDLEEIIYGCSEGYDFSFDFDQLLACKDELIKVLEMLP